LINLRKKRMGEKRVAVFVDGPNMLRREFDTDLGLVKKELRKFGPIKVSKVFLNQFAPEKLIEAVVNQGFEPVIVTSDDIDAPMAAEVMETIFTSSIDVIALVTRDGDFQSVIMKAKKYGKETVVVGSEPFSATLRNTADSVIILKEKRP